MSVPFSSIQPRKFSSTKTPTAVHGATSAGDMQIRSFIISYINVKKIIQIIMFSCFASAFVITNDIKVTHLMDVSFISNV